MGSSASIFGRVAVPQEGGHTDPASCESPQIGLLWCGTEAVRRFGCPIEIEHFPQMPATPQNGPNYGEEAGEAVLPRMAEGQEADQQVGQQADPDLPAYGIGVMAKEVGELDGLLDLLEEYLDIPPATVKFGYRPGAPAEIIGQELQLPIFSIEFDQRDHAAQTLGVGSAAGIGGQFNDFVAQHAGVVGGGQGLDDAAREIILGPADPKDPVGLQAGEMVKVHVGLVKHHDFPGLKPGAQFPRLGAIMEPRGIDNDAPRQETLQVQPDMTFGGRLPASVLCPVQALGDQLDGGRIHGMDRPVEPAQPDIA